MPALVVVPPRVKLLPTAPAENLIPEVVARGVRLLNRDAPAWWDKVDPDAIDMLDTRLCVAGQVFGHVWRLPILRDLTVPHVDADPDTWSRFDEAVAHRICGYGLVSWPEQAPALTREWVRVIEELRATDRPRSTTLSMASAA